MSDPAEKLPAPTPRLHRRRQRVVVRATSVVPAPASERRRKTHTLPGVGARAELDTLPDASMPGKRRPVVLYDGVHDLFAEAYLEEAERLLESGIFDDSDCQD